MAFPTIEELRLQCRIDHEDEDQLLNIYLKAAIKRTEYYLKRSLIDDKQVKNDFDLIITDDIKAALIFVVGYWYDCRDLSKIPNGFYELLKSHRVITI